jgi:hypothetical protein
VVGLAPEHSVVRDGGLVVQLGGDVVEVAGLARSRAEAEQAFARLVDEAFELAA